MFLTTESNPVANIFQANKNMDMNMKKRIFLHYNFCPSYLNLKKRQDAPFLNTGFVKVKDILSWEKPSKKDQPFF